jgi:DNA-binding beta-propeller fold protein YncE
MGLNRTHHRSGSGKLAPFSILACIFGFAVLMLTWGSSEGIHPAHHATGSPQLVSISPLPEMDGELCPMVPASATTSLEAMLQQGAGNSATQSYTPMEDDRAPLRVIRDNYPTYSAIAVDVISNEVYLQDENLFGYKVFDRMTNTPPAAAFSEPKRMVGGLETKLEFNCGLYVDPVTGEIYSINNDTVNTMVIFAREAEGNIPPKRELTTPHRTYGIMADEEAQELYMTVEDPPQVVVYRKQASGDEEPLRVLEGPSTQLEDAHGIALDKKNGWMFVSNHGSSADDSGAGHFEPPSITVYPMKASGDVAPLRIIEGPRTQLNWPAAMTLDEQAEEVYVANDADNSILVFSVNASGNAAPKRVIKGPKTGIRHPTGIFLDLKNKELWISNMGNHSATVFRMDAQGDAAPLRTIRSAPQGKLAQAIGNPGAVGYDSKREEVLVPN